MRGFKHFTALAAVSLWVCMHASAQDPASATTGAPREEGIWKAVVPPTP